MSLLTDLQRIEARLEALFLRFQLPQEHAIALHVHEACMHILVAIKEAQRQTPRS